MARTEVLVLGTYHMHNPGLDYVKGALDDHLSPRRQREIEDVVARLARFRPTKILIESPYGGNQFDARYAQYRAGAYRLTADERDQVAMRLAKRLDHRRLWPIDFQQPMDIATVMEMAQKHGDPAVVKALGEGQAEVSRMLGRISGQTVRRTLLDMNTSRSDRFTQGLYNLMARINADPDDYRGVDAVSGWYRRNLRIFANIAKTIQPGDGRVLVLIGAGHAPILRQLMREAPDMKLIEVDKVLG